MNNPQRRNPSKANSGENVSQRRNPIKTNSDKNQPLRGRNINSNTYRNNVNENYRDNYQNSNQHGGNPMTPRVYQDVNQYEVRYATPRQQQPNREGYSYDTQTFHQQGNSYPPNHYPDPRYSIPTQNRYQALAYEDYNEYHQQREPFLGQRGNRGRGGGTPRGNPYPMNKRGRGRNPTTHHTNRDIIPARREGEGAGQGDENNPRKRMRAV